MSEQKGFVSVPSVQSPIVVSVYGPRALFTLPQHNVERLSSPVPPKSSLKGILRAVYKHDGMNYEIDRVYVCNKVDRDVIWRNEVTDTQVFGDGFSPKVYLDARKCRSPRGTSFLVDVRYVVEAHIVELPHFWPDSRHHSLDEHYKMFFRHLRRGACQHTPWLGCREFEGCVEEFSGPVESYYHGRKERFGILLEDILYTRQGLEFPVWCDTGIVDGVVTYYGERIYPKGMPPGKE